ncbi:MAG: DNA (cytosine-5-)-methyltransferase [Acholeplasmataceae bacterium]
MFEKKLIKKPIRIIELFGGYGSQYMALKYLGANVESYKLVEWEVAAIEAYTRFHHEYKHFECDDLTSELYNLGISNDGKVPMTLQQIERRSDEWKQKVYNNIRSSNNLVNILTTKGKDLEIVEKNKYEYIMTYSFPCQDLSLAGKGAGLGEGTRSGLLWQVERILLELKDLNELPQILLMENVLMILSPKYKDDFAKWDLALSKLGYKSYVKNLIATDYSIPQIRNRTFMISILGEYSYAFPNKLKKEYILKDFLENNVDESYYLSDKQISDINNWKAYQKPFETMKQIEKTGNSPTITTRSGAYAAGMILVDEIAGEEREVKEYKNYVSWEDNKGRINTQDNRAYSKNVVGTIPAMERGVPKILIPEKTKKGYAVAEDGNVVVVREEYQGMYQYSKSDKFMQGKDRFTKNKELADTILTTPKEGVVVKNKINGSESLRIRKLTPKECFRLMGVKDRDYDKIADFSNSSLYKLAGNSIVIQVLMGIFGELLGIDYKKKIKESVKEIV